MADFFAGVAQGLPGGIQLGMQFGQMQRENAAAAQKQQLEQQKAAGEVLSNFAETLANAPEDQWGDLYKTMRMMYMQMRGIKSNPAADKLWSNPQRAAATFMRAYNSGDINNLKDIDNLFTDPIYALGIQRAVNQAVQTKNAQADVAQGMGEGRPGMTQAPASLGGLAGTPLDQPLPDEGSAPVSGIPTGSQPAIGTPSVGNLQGLNTALAKTQEALGKKNLNKLDIDRLQGRATMLQQQIALTVNNEAARALAAMGVTNPTPQALQLAQQQVINNAGLTKRAEATGAFLGGPFPPSVLTEGFGDPGLTVEEQRGQRGGLAQGLPGAAPAGGPGRILTPAEKANLASMRVGFEKEKERRAVVAEAAASQQNILDSITTLLDANPSFETGALAPARLQMQRLVNGITGQKNANMTTAQMLQSLGDSMSFPLLKAIGGNDSNTDREFARNIIVNLGRDQVSNRIMLDFTKIQAQRTQDLKVLHSEFHKRYGADASKSPVDFDTFERAWKEEHSLQSQYQAVLDKYGYKQQAATALGTQPAAAAAQPTRPSFVAPTQRSLPNVTVPGAETPAGGFTGGMRGIRPRIPTQ